MKEKNTTIGLKHLKINHDVQWKYVVQDKYTKNTLR